MRERTPSADDTPKRAPPAPPREAASAHVLVDGRSVRIVDDSTRTTSGLSSCTERRIITMVASEQGLDKLRTNQSTINSRAQQEQTQPYNCHINHLQNNNNNNNHHNYPERQGIAGYRSAQTAQDKRSRLSNVINNLRKKVPPDNITTITTATTTITASDNESRRTKDTSYSHLTNRQEDEARNSVERNLANLEKYVMTVLNGVIKDSESKDQANIDIIDNEKPLTRESLNDKSDVLDGKVEKSLKKDNDADDPGTFGTEPLKPNRSYFKGSVPGTTSSSKNDATFDDEKITKNEDITKVDTLNPEGQDCRLNNDDNEIISLDKHCNVPEFHEEASVSFLNTSREEPEVEKSPLRHSDNGVQEITNFANLTANADAMRTSLIADRSENSIAKDITAEKNDHNDETIASLNSEDKRKNKRSLGTLILDRFDHPITINDAPTLEADSEAISSKMNEDSENHELRTICRDLLNGLLNDICQLIEEKPVDNEDKSFVTVVNKDKNEVCEKMGENSNTSIQCSLPLDKVASILQNCQTTSESISSSTCQSSYQAGSKTPTKSTSPTIRHLCLYCDRKFLSISLRQRHTERVHQLGGGRRSDRNSRKTTQSCQYCAEKCADNLDSLFQHMITNHTDKYHACGQCATRYSNRETLVGHMSDTHGQSCEKSSDNRESNGRETTSSLKESSISVSTTREQSNKCKKDTPDAAVASKDRRVEEESDKREAEATTVNPSSKNIVKSPTTSRDPISNPGSPEFDSAFYSSVSCNIRDNLLHHLDGKLQVCTNTPGGATNDVKLLYSQQQQQSCYDHSNSNSMQLPIDISLTAATPVYNKEYSNDEYENSSEYAQKPGKAGRSHPRRVSFEKYNFPRKYDGKEQWTCSIKDLSKFDISTQLTLRKKQQLIKERLTANRLNNGTLGPASTDILQPDGEHSNNDSELIEQNFECLDNSRIPVVEESNSTKSRTYACLRDGDNSISDHNLSGRKNEIDNVATEFTAEFGNFLRLKRWNVSGVEVKNNQDIVYAELTGEWSRPRVYICGACTSKHLTLRELEEHKTASHPNVWCSHLEFTGDQRELYKHLFLPGRSTATSKAKNAVLSEKVCTKCSKSCGSLAELHRHMLECGGDQAWLLGLFGNGKKKCKWRPFGSRSRRRRHRGMKRNIQNSQTPRVNQPRERNSSGPRVRPSDRESIQKMLANLPPKRASRRVMQDTTVRTQGRLRKMQTRSRPRLVDAASSTSRLSQKAVLRNKLLKNAKSFQRKRCRRDNITAAIERVVKKSEASEKPRNENENDEADEEEREGEGEEEEEEEEEEDDDVKDDSGLFKESRKFENPKAHGEMSKIGKNLESSNRSTKIVRGVRVVSKKRNVKSNNLHNAVVTKTRTRRGATATGNSKPKNKMNISKNNEKNTDSNVSTGNIIDAKSLSSNSSSPSHSAILRRKKHVDPVVSLHASLKARSQLRTHDGKFARRVDTIVRSQRNESTRVSTRRNNLVLLRAVNSDKRVGRKKLSNKNVSESEKSTPRCSTPEKRRNNSTNREITKKNQSESEKSSSVNVAPSKESSNQANKKIAKKNTSETENNSKTSLVDQDNGGKVTRKSLAKRNSSELEKRIDSTAEKIDKEDESSTSAGIIDDSTSNASGKSKKSLNSKKTLSGQHTQNVEIDLDEAISKNVIDVTRIKSAVQDVSREQRPSRGRRKKIVDDQDIKSMETPTDLIDATIGEIKTKNRDSTSEASSNVDNNEESSKRANSKDSRIKESKEKEDATKQNDKSESQCLTKKLENVKSMDSRRARQERRAGSLEDFSKIRDVPDEVKRLLGPTEDLLTQIGLKTRDDAKKTRQVQRPRVNSPRNKGQKKNATVDEKEDDSRESEKCALRVSQRKLDKKEAKCSVAGNNEREETEVSKEDTKIVEAIEEIIPEEVRSAKKIESNIGKRRGRIKSRVENENIEASVRVDVEEGNNAAPEEKTKDISVSVGNIGDPNSEESIGIIHGNTVKSIEPIVHENPKTPFETKLDKNAKQSIGNIADAHQEGKTVKFDDKNKDEKNKQIVNKKVDQSIVSRHLDESIEMAIKNHLQEPIETIVEKNLGKSVEKVVDKSFEESLEIGDENLDETIEIVDKCYNESIETDSTNIIKDAFDMVDKTNEDSDETIEQCVDEKSIEKTVKGNIMDVAALSFEHLQQESSNSNIDSGKENSSETPVNVSKLKVVRPKKCRGSRRDRTGKRTLNNVIGILTEGVNIPVEVQQSVILTVQTAIETTSETGNQSDSSQIAGNNAAAGESSNIRGSVKPNEITDTACNSADTDESRVIQESEKTKVASTEKKEECEESEKIRENFDEDSEKNILQPEVECCDPPKILSPASYSVKTTGFAQTAATEPANDIILDLSRRKPKGKGSFLEKIVSKIAKQKDALLETDVGCLLDNAADELTNILSEINPSAIDHTETSSRIQPTTKKVLNDTIFDDKQSRDEKIVITPKMIVPDEVKNDESIPIPIDVDIEAGNKREKQLEPTAQQFPTTKTITPIPAEEFSASPTDTTASTNEEHETDESERKRTSKKRSLEATTTPKKNKRKTVDEKIVGEDSSEEEICLADIMNLMNRTKQISPNIDDKCEQKVHSGKRKIVEVDKEENQHCITNVSLCVETIENRTNSRSSETDMKKSKRNEAEKLPIFESSNLEKHLKDNENVDSSFINELSNLELNKSSENIQSCSQASNVLNSEINTKIEEETIVGVEKNKSRPVRKCVAKKKSLAEEHLNLSEDDEEFNDILSRSTEEIGNSASLPVSASSKAESIEETVESSKTMESFKLPDVNESVTSRKRITRKQSLPENLQSSADHTIASKNIFPSEIHGVTDKLADIEQCSLNGEKEKTLSDKIDIVEQTLSVDTVLPLENNRASKSHADTSESVDIDELELEKSSKKVGSVENDGDTTEGTQSDSLTEDDVQSEGAAEMRRNSTRRAKEPFVNDEASPFSDAKLQRKFAVVHTKSGKMLIVEKKKKFTKEAAKFFCEICAASFTRKSSLKKHNSSQSHLLQVSKCFEENEKITVSQETHVSIIDNSEDVSKTISVEEPKGSLMTKFDDEKDNIDTAEKPEKDENEEMQESRIKDSLEEMTKIDEEQSIGEVDHAISPDRLCENSITSTEQTDDSNVREEKLDDFEDELLDEEICKITENMTHDEYVLTDHVSPVVPEASSTPVTNISIRVSDTPDSIKKINDIAKGISLMKDQEDRSKINLANEHLDLDSPVAHEILAKAKFSNSSQECLGNALVGSTCSQNIVGTLPIESRINKIVREKSILEIPSPIKENPDSIASNVTDESNHKTSRSKRKIKKSITKDADPLVGMSDVVGTSKSEDRRDGLSKNSDGTSENTIVEESTPELLESREERLEVSEDKSANDSSSKNHVKEPAKTEMPIILDFSNIAKKLKTQTTILPSDANETSCNTEFESDEDTLDTHMSDDIRKILDDSELDTDNKQLAKKLMSPETGKKCIAKKNDSSLSESAVVGTKRNKQKTKSEEPTSAKKEKTMRKSSRNKNVTKEIVKRSRTSRPRKNRNSSKTKIDDTSESEYDEKKDVIESQNKNKIVKSVFGRVFGGEKIDKVKEVLEDWVSRSEGDSHDDTQTSIDIISSEKIDKIIPTPTVTSSLVSKRTRRDEEKSLDLISQNSSLSESHTSEKGRGKKRGRSKNSEVTSGADNTERNRSNDETKSASKSATHGRKKNSDWITNNDSSIAKIPNEADTGSRCRQSKKRAEERISRAFEDECSIVFADTELLTHIDASIDTKNSRNSREHRQEHPISLEHVSSECKNKKRTQHEDKADTKATDESDDEKLGNKSSKDVSRLNEEASVSRDENLQNVQSLKDTTDVIRADDKEEEEDEEEDEDEIALGRLSPLYVCNTPESSIESSSNSENEEGDERQNDERVVGQLKNDIRRSPISIASKCHERTEISTININYEDNAIDVPRTDHVTSSSEKSRQGKVLNFDEELFVECCSRLKATTENELRGTKKIKLDHHESLGINDEEQRNLRSNRDRWRDVESQNSLGSLLESVNQLLGEEMYSGNRTSDYAKRGRHNVSERSSRSASPDVDTTRQENPGYEDSLDVAFEHNNKLRVKIQQRMKESENLIASTFGQKASGTGLHRHHHHHHHHHHHRAPNHQRHHDTPHIHKRENRQNEHDRKENTTVVHEKTRNDESYDDRTRDKAIERNDKRVELDCTGFRNKNPALGGLIDNLLHSNGKHDHNGSTPMNVLAELACARVPTSTLPETKPSLREKSIKSPSRPRDSSPEDRPIAGKDATSKKPRNPIKELFERKNEINERKHREKIESDVTSREINLQRQKKSKKPKKQQDFPLIRKSQLGGMVERKKRREDKKIIASGTVEARIKDIYDFDDDESQEEPSIVMSYRNKNEKNHEIVNTAETTELDMTDLMTKAIGQTLNNGKSGDVLGKRLESMVDRKFQEIETFPPKTKGALKSFQIEEKQQNRETEQRNKKEEEEEARAEQKNEKRITGPMDDFVERKKSSRKLTAEQTVNKHGKSKKRSKNSKKKSRNAWYENDSSDEFVTAAKAEDVGVGTTRSQRTCSKGKQNLFAELSTSSESDYENVEENYEAKRRVSHKKKNIDNEDNSKDIDVDEISPVANASYDQDNENVSIVDWITGNKKADGKNELEHKKSESEMSDHPLIIDERKNETDETRNSDDDIEAPYVPAFELDDLYREDTSDETDEDTNNIENTNDREDGKTRLDEETPREKEEELYNGEKDLIPLEEALDLLDSNEDLSRIPERIRAAMKSVETMENDDTTKGEITSEIQNDEMKMMNDSIDSNCEASNNEEPEEEAELPEKLSSNEKPKKESDSLPLHVFLSRKVYIESKKRKQQEAKRLQEEQERILMDFPPTRRQRKCAIGKQGLLAEISSSDDESYPKETCKRTPLVDERTENERHARKPKRESKEKRKERYMEKKHEQIIAKEQKAIEEEILRELEKTKGNSCKSDSESCKSDKNALKDYSIVTDKSETEDAQITKTAGKKKRQQKSRKSGPLEISRDNSESEKHEKPEKEKTNEDSTDKKLKNDENNYETSERNSTLSLKKQSKSSQRTKKTVKTPEVKTPSVNRKCKISNSDKAKSKSTSTLNKDPKERRSSCGKRDSDDEELPTTKCWNKVDEGVGVAIGRRKRAAANQLYYWSSSSDDEEPAPPPTPIVEEEDDRQEQHGWIVGDSHKRMITMLAMEKQLKEKRRRSEDEFEPSKSKNKKHRNSTS